MREKKYRVKSEIDEWHIDYEYERDAEKRMEELNELEGYPDDHTLEIVDNRE